MMFTKKEALAILKSSSESEVEEQYEQMIFEWKQKYLSQTPPIQIIKSHITKIERLNNAVLVFKSYNHVGVGFNLLIHLDNHLLDFLNTYQSDLMRLKLSISNAKNGVILIDLLSQLINLEHELFKKLNIYNAELGFTEWDMILISKNYDIFDIQQELLKIEVKESGIIDYIRNEIKIGTFPYKSNLTNLVLKGIKYCKNECNS